MKQPGGVPSPPKRPEEVLLLRCTTIRLSSLTHSLNAANLAILNRQVPVLLRLLSAPLGHRPFQ